jgi:hypothetical protein
VKSILLSVVSNYGEYMQPLPVNPLLELVDVYIGSFPRDEQPFLCRTHELKAKLKSVNVTFDICLPRPQHGLSNVCHV